MTESGLAPFLAPQLPALGVADTNFWQSNENLGKPRNYGLGYALRHGVPSATSGMQSNLVDAVRQQKEVIDQRVAAAKLALREKSRKLKVERSKVADQEAQVQKSWANVQVAFARADKAEEVLVDPGLAMAWAGQLRELHMERTTLVHERTRVRELATAAEERLSQALTLSREHAHQWELHATQQRIAEEQRELILQERLQAQEDSTRIRMELAEQKEEERIHKALAISNERVREALEVSKHQGLELEMQQAKRREAEAKREREAQALLVAREALAKAEILEAELNARNKQCIESSIQMQAWKDSTIAETRLHMLAKVRKAEELAAQAEARTNARCKDEHQRLLERSEALTEERLAQARNQVEQSARSQVACLRDEWRVRQAAWSREFEASESIRRQACEQREAAEERSRQELLVSQFADQKAAREEAVVLEMRRYVEERQGCKIDLLSKREAYEEAVARRLAQAGAQHRATCEAEIVAEVGDLLREGEAREEAWKQQISAAEALQEEACLSARQLEERGLCLQRDYAARLGDLLGETSRLQQENNFLAYHRHEAFRMQQDSVFNSFQSVPLVGDDPKCSPSGFRNHSPDQLSTAASSGFGVPIGVSGNSISAGDWDATDPAPSHRSLCSSTLGPSISARGHEIASSSCMRKQFNTPDSVLALGTPSVSVNGSPVEALLATHDQPSQGHWGDPVPLVYAQALTNIEHHGWDSVHPKGEAPVWTVLHWAAAEGRAGICLRLLSARADPLVQDDQGKSALDYARQADGGDDGDAWNILAEAIESENSNTASSKQPPRLPILNLAAAHALAAGEPTSSEALQDSPEELPIPDVYASAISAVERYGWETVHGGEAEWTALHWAASEGRATICARLLECRADPSQPDNLGRSALDYAHEVDDEDTLAVLLNSMPEEVNDCGF